MGNSKSTQSQTALRSKFLLIGRNTVGKTALLKRYESNEFSEEYVSTVGCDLKSFDYSYQGVSCQLMVMDSLTDSDLHMDCRLKTIKNSDIAAVVLDLTSLDSYLDLEKKFELLKENGYRNNHVLLIGTKADSEIKAVDEDSIAEVFISQKEYKIEYFETSSKTGQNVEKVFFRALELGIGMESLVWERVKGVLFLYHNLSPDSENTSDFSWFNLCEAVPSLIKKKKQVESSLVKLPPELLGKLITYL